jgi:hypothetical protein
MKIVGVVILTGVGDGCNRVGVLVSMGKDVEAGVIVPRIGGVAM